MVVLYATYIYLADLAFFYRRVEAFLETLGIKRSYEAVRQQAELFGSKLKGYVEDWRDEDAVTGENLTEFDRLCNLLV